MNKNYFLIIIIVSIIISGCNKKPADTYWEGLIYRTGDDKDLGFVQVVLKEDSMLFYTDAIFGAKHDTLVVDKEKSIDSTLFFKNYPHNLKFKGGTDEEGTPYKYIYGDGYYIIMFMKDGDYLSGDYKIIYRNKNVPINPYYYLDGKYTGRLEFKNELYELFTMMSVGSMNVSVEFLDGNKAKGA